MIERLVEDPRRKILFAWVVVVELDRSREMWLY